MKTALIGLVLLLVPSAALADENTYTEHKTDSGSAVVFKDDPLGALSNNPVGAIIPVRARATRLTLMRPRLHFVPELLQSVEKM
jgi:hypothetical protein